MLSLVQVLVGSTLAVSVAFRVLKGLSSKVDSTALRLWMERLAPAPKDRPIDFPLPAANSAREINMALANVAEAVGAGTPTAAEGNSLEKR